MRSQILFAILAPSVLAATPMKVNKRQDDMIAVCPTDFVPCAPDGTTSLSTPDIFSNSGNVLEGLTNAGDYRRRAVKKSKRAIDEASLILCCDPTVSCMLMTDGVESVPFCYDDSTTEFVFADGSAGLLSTGEVYDGSGNYLNLETGDYEFINGTTGNLYEEEGSPAPTTVALPTAATSVAADNASFRKIGGGKADPTASSTASKTGRKAGNKASATGSRAQSTADAEDNAAMSVRGTGAWTAVIGVVAAAVGAGLVL
ncbi:MAG: hypothetical protein M1833_005623 [Piccolia ochrophora]|nr:MAG: hypothetical protein M1833_005623 [Piccolia ochrophora]